MNQLKFGSLGEAWIYLTRQTLEQGEPMGEEGYELLTAAATFPVPTGADPLVDRFGEQRMLAEMEKVFFSEGPNSLGHSYLRLMRGPRNRSDLLDVVELLRVEPATKRAVVTLCGEGNGKIPCLNIVQFLNRGGKLNAIYFARGQDVYKKFYADALCVARMAREVAGQLALPAGFISAIIGSCHLYHQDVPAVRNMLETISVSPNLSAVVGAP